LRWASNDIPFIKDTVMAGQKFKSIGNPSHDAEVGADIRHGYVFSAVSVGRHRNLISFTIQPVCLSILTLNKRVRWFNLLGKWQDPLFDFFLYNGRSNDIALRNCEGGTNETPNYPSGRSQEVRRLIDCSSSIYSSLQYKGR
jgi:hypothetical protein